MKSKSSISLVATPSKVNALQKKVADASELRDCINQDIDSASMRDLSKLSTMYRSIMVIVAKICKESVKYEADQKMLIINRQSFDFS